MREGACSAVVEEGLTPGSSRPGSEDWVILVGGKERVVKEYLLLYCKFVVGEGSVPGLYRPGLVGGGREVVEEYSLLWGRLVIVWVGLDEAVEESPPM